MDNTVTNVTSAVALLTAIGVLLSMIIQIRRGRFDPTKTVADAAAVNTQAAISLVKPLEERILIMDARILLLDTRVADQVQKLDERNRLIVDLRSIVEKQTTTIGELRTVITDLQSTVMRQTDQIIALTGITKGGAS